MKHSLGGTSILLYFASMGSLLFVASMGLLFCGVSLVLLFFVSFDEASVLRCFAGTFVVLCFNGFLCFVASVVLLFLFALMGRCLSRFVDPSSFDRATFKSKHVVFEKMAAWWSWALVMLMHGSFFLSRYLSNICVEQFGFLPILVGSSTETGSALTNVPRQIC